MQAEKGGFMKNHASVHHFPRQHPSLWLLGTGLLFFLFTASPLGSQAPAEKTNYRLAARFSEKKIKKMVFATNVDAHWMKHSDRLWYSFETPEAKTFILVDPVKKTKTPIFDNVRMAAMLTELTKDPYDSRHLPIEEIKFINRDQTIRFEVESSQDDDSPVESEEEEETEDEEKEKKPKKKILTFEYTLDTGQLTLLTDYKKPPKTPKWASISPDGETIVFARHHNLYWMDKANYEKILKDKKAEGVVEQALTKDGEEYYSYAARERGQTNIEKEKNRDKRKEVRIVWSHDSKRFALVRTDERKVKDLWVINSIAEPRPTLETYKYHMPGESESPRDEICIFDLATQGFVTVPVKRFPDQGVSILTAKPAEKTRDDKDRPQLWLAKTSDKLYFTRTSRDLHRIDLCIANAETGEVKILIEERLNTYVETRRPGLIRNGSEIIHWSERDGWAHFYLHDDQGRLKNRITSGPFHCQDIAGIDEKNRILYFTANAREAGEDPYYTHLYRINFDGSGLRLLTEKQFSHEIRMDDSARFFVDNHSRVDTAPTTELKDHLGRPLLALETADLSRLMEAGFKYPETFRVKADDGITDLYGVMYKPYDFDPERSYPIIAYVYPGPQTEAVDKSFSLRGERTFRLAQFGFIVITVGNRGGHPNRSKWYHNYGYGDLRDYGLADKKTAIEQLCDRHPFIDIDRVGIFGHSGGGFMSTAAMLVYPDFFKVAVSTSGNHENNIYNRWWSEKHHGVKEVVDDEGNVTFQYQIEKNSELAKNLKGHLLLATGDIDNNVHPGNTIRMANALIKANKRFDFFLLPGQRHGYGDMTEYFFWIRGDYFCRHLLGRVSADVDIVELNREREMRDSS